MYSTAGHSGGVELNNVQYIGHEPPVASADCLKALQSHKVGNRNRTPLPFPCQSL
jgi:hypothetical protein